jgi:hypothetical protein
MSIEQLQERITWLRYEFEQQLERYLHNTLDAHGLTQATERLTSHREVDELGDELLQHTFWAVQHITYQPACWAPKREELEYLLLCLRAEENFDPDQVAFTYHQYQRAESSE